MPDESARRGVVVTLQVLLAMLFLAIIGGVVGYLAGGRVNQHRHQVGQSNAGTGTNPGGASTTTTGTRCPPHTENQAGTGPLRQVLYLRTARSEVWICADATGRLFYQGHGATGQPLVVGEPLVEGKNALFLTEVAKEGADGYLAINRDPAGAVTEYQVTSQRLIIRYTGYATPKQDRTEPAVSS